MVLNGDDYFMERAFALAEEALADDEVPVGCVFVHNHAEIGSGRNRVNKTKDPTAHAELVALRQMQESIPSLKETLSEVTLYVTLEPCIMCASALYQIGICKIIYGAQNERFGGICSVGSAEKYRCVSTCETIGLVDNERSISLLKQFYDKQNPFAPEDKKKIKKSKCE